MFNQLLNIHFIIQIWALLRVKGVLIVRTEKHGLIANVLGTPHLLFTSLNWVF